MSPSRHLDLLPPSPGPGRAGSIDAVGVISLPKEPGVVRFLEVSADAGLAASDAVRLALTRALVLADIGPFGFDVMAARHLLRTVAASARPRRPLAPEQASYARRLSMGRPTSAPSMTTDLSVCVPEMLLSRAEEKVRPATFSPEIVSEMVAWELAATLDGRTMGEWALTTLAAARSNI